MIMARKLLPGAEASSQLGGEQSRWDTVNGLAMHARTWLDERNRDRPVVVLVHGLCVSSRYMIPLARLLAPGYRVYVPDLPGFGRSEQPAQVLDVSELCLALGRWMDVVGIQRATLIGNSLGCQVIAALAAGAPERVERAVLIGPTVDAQARSFWRQLLRGMQDVLRERPALWPILVHDYLVAGVRRTLRTTMLMIADRIELQLPRMPMPVLVVRGGRDPIVPHRWAETVARLLPQGQLVVLPHSPHAGHFSTPQSLLQVVLRFLEPQRYELALEHGSLLRGPDSGGTV